MTPPEPTPLPVHSRRLVRSHLQRIHAPPERVFLLLCPERETEWLPGWRYRMIHSESGLAEEGAVFATDAPQGTTLWTVTHHEPCHRVGFVRWQPDELVTQIDLRLSADSEQATQVAIRYVHTSTGSRGDQALEAMTDAQWQSMMQFWEESMNQWLKDHPGQTPA